MQTFASAGDTVLDPFMGSGVLAKICKDESIDFIGFDINPSAMAIADMFVDPPASKDVLHVLELISVQVEHDIRSLYMTGKGEEATHIVRKGDEIKEVWIKDKGGTKMGDPDLIFNTDPEHRKARRLFERPLFPNPRINVSQNQTIAILFTPRARASIDRLLNAIEALAPHQQKIGKYILTSAVGQMSKMVFAIKRRRRANKEDKRKYEVGSWVIGYWRPKLYMEINAWRVFEGRARKLARAVERDSTIKSLFAQTDSKVTLKKGDGFKLLAGLPGCSIGTIITDPPHNDRIPYLELSEVWNAMLGEFPVYEDEWVLSNAVARGKDAPEFHKGLHHFFSQTSRILKEDGKLILIFNTTDMDVWSILKLAPEASGLFYRGRFPAEYSARSVVQDSRRGSLKHDWCLVYTKSKVLPIEHRSLEGWTDEWIN